MRTITNMAFRQSRLWSENVDSIYDLTELRDDPPGMGAWREAWALYLARASYDVVLTMGARCSLLYGLLCSLSIPPSKQIMTEVFIDQYKPESLLWRAKTGLYRVVAHRAIGVLTNSSTEVDTIGERFRIPEQCLIHVPLHTTIHEPANSAIDRGFILAAGRSQRDYPTLLKAVAGLEFPLTIVAGPQDLQGVAIPEHVTVRRELERDVYLDLLRVCSIVVIPLVETCRSTGQVVMLEAMALGKPVIATRSPGTTDHIEHERNGLLVTVGNAHEMEAAISDLLNDRSKAQRLAEQALVDVQRSNLFDTHAQSKLDAIATLVEQHRKNGESDC